MSSFNKYAILEKLIIGIFILVFSYIVYEFRKSDSSFKKIISDQNPQILRESPTAQTLEELKLDENNAKIIEMSEQLHVEEQIEVHRKQIDDSNKSISEFAIEAKMEMQFPPGFLFKSVDVDVDGVAVIHGTNETNSGLTVVATNKDLSAKQALFELSKNNDFIPSIDNTALINIKNTIDKPDTENFSDIQLFTFSDQKNKEIRAAFGKRKDGKGLYVIILDSQKGEFNKTEELYYNALDSIQLKD